MKESEIILYTTPNGEVKIDIRFEDETFWMTQKKVAHLFDVEVNTINYHLKEIFKSGELPEDSTIRKNRIVQTEGTRKVTRDVEFYNLDAIIAVGYRVNSFSATQFRIWANSVLKDYLIKGYAINEKRLAQKEQEILILKNGIQILNRAIEEKTVDNEWLATFTEGLSLLDDYDHELLDTKGLTTKEAVYPSKDEYQELINEMLDEFDSDVFGRAKDESFEASLIQIEKGFEDKDFYPTLEEKAAMLLYLIVKNHSFVDGNKRIAAACFLKFLQENNMLFNAQQQPIINNDTLASLTLFTAVSKPEEMETVKRLVISVLNRNKE